MKRCVCWWVFWVLVTSEVTRHLPDDSGNSDIPQIQQAWQVQFLVARRILGNFPKQSVAERGSYLYSNRISPVCQNFPSPAWVPKPMYLSPGT